MDSLKKIKSFGLFLGLILIVLGIVFLVFSEKVVEVTAMALGAGLLIYGAVQLLAALITWKSEEESKFMKIIKLVFSVILLGFGVYLIINSNVTIAAIGVAIGVFAIMSAFDRFSVMFKRMKAGLKFLPAFLCGIIHLAFGAGMIYATVNMMALIVMLAGVYLIIAGMMIIISSCYFFDFV